MGTGEAEGWEGTAWRRADQPMPSFPNVTHYFGGRGRPSPSLSHQQSVFGGGTEKIHGLEAFAASALLNKPAGR